MEEKYCFLRSVPMNSTDEQQQQKEILKTRPLKVCTLRKEFDANLSP